MEKPYFFVDDISEGIATLLFGDEGEQRLEVPLSLLPLNTREGDWLLACFSVDPSGKERVRDRIERLLDELGDNP